MQVGRLEKVTTAVILLAL